MTAGGRGQQPGEGADGSGALADPNFHPDTPEWFKYYVGLLDWRLNKLRLDIRFDFNQNMAARGWSQPKPKSGSLSLSRKPNPATPAG